MCSGSNDSLVVHENITAFDVSVEEILLVAVVEAIQELSHDGGIVLLRELYHPRLQEPHKVMVHVLKH